MDTKVQCREAGTTRSLMPLPQPPSLLPSPLPASTDSNLGGVLLIGIVLFARTNELTTNCPLYEDMELPPPDARQQWDCDGLPKYIILALRCARPCYHSSPPPLHSSPSMFGHQEMENPPSSTLL